MPSNKCCCCDLRTGCLILLGICFVFGANDITLKSSHDEWLLFIIEFFFIGFGFAMVLKGKSKFLWPTIIYLIVESTIIAVGLFVIDYKVIGEYVNQELKKINEYKHNRAYGQHNQFQEYNIQLNVEFVGKVIQSIIILTIVLYLSTALALWKYKKVLQEKEEATGQIPLYQPQFPNVQPQAQQLYPQNLTGFAQYPQNQAQVPLYPQTIYSQDPPPYSEIKVNLAQ